MDDGEVLRTFKAHAREISRVTGEEVSAKQAAYWAKRGVYRVRRQGYFYFTTRTAIREDFSPPPDAAA
jgi:hypothetical protein